MNKSDVLNSSILKSHFCEEFCVPVGTIFNPYFENQIKIMDRVYQCNEKFNDFCDDMYRFNNPIDYISEYERSAKRASKDFNNKFEIAMDDFFDACEYSSYRTNSLKLDSNDGKCFISIQVENPNYTALSNYSANIFDGKSWEDYVLQFTNIKHLAKSDKFINNVFTNKYFNSAGRNYIMPKLCKPLEKESRNTKIYSVSNDEIILSILDKCYANINELRNIIDLYKVDNPTLNIDYKIKPFFIKKFGTGWIKEYFIDDETEFLGFSPALMIQAVKYYYGLPITKDDLVFSQDGMLARFDNPMYKPWLK